MLVRTNDRGQELAAALRAAGLPATFNGTNSVLASDAAADWLTLLRALDQPRRPYLQRALLTDFVGATVPRLALADDDQHGAWSLRIHTWARVLERSGIPALFAAFDADADFRARLLSRPDGERLVTDHRHIAELLHQHHMRSRAAARARDLATWLVAERDGGGGGSDTTRRRDTDADAVQVMTIHRAKGLQWPVVLLPEVGHQREAEVDTGRLLVLPAGDSRMLDVGGAPQPAPAPTAGRAGSRRRPTRRCAPSTSASPARSPGWSPGGPTTGTRRPHRCTGCCTRPTTRRARGVRPRATPPPT